MRDQQERRPQNCRADSEMVVEVSGYGAENGFRRAVFVQPGVPETGVSGLIVALKVEAVLDQWRAGEGVIADSIAANPRIQQGKRENEEQKEPSLRFACGRRDEVAHVLVLHKRSLIDSNTRVAKQFPLALKRKFAIKPPPVDQTQAA